MRDQPQRYLVAFTTLSLVLSACGQTPTATVPAAAGAAASVAAQVSPGTSFQRVLDPRAVAGRRDLPTDKPVRSAQHLRAQTLSAQSIQAQTLGGDIQHDEASPFPFDEPRSTNVVNDSDGPNSNQYNSRSVGIRINVPIRRWVGETSGGYLTNPSRLVTEGVVSPTFKLRLPTYDVDGSTRPVFDCDGDSIDDQLNEEVDDVYWNGEKIGSFRGTSNTWTQFIQDLPISKLKFPAQPGDTANNLLEIRVDQKNKDVVLSSGAVGCEVWFTEVDWAQVTFQAMSPVVFIHGINNTGTKWAKFTSHFRAAGLPVATDANGVSPTWRPTQLNPQEVCEFDSIRAEAAQLVPQLTALARRYGTESLHLVGHSKGGQDSRGILRYYSLAGGTAITPTGGLKLTPAVTVGEMSGQTVQQRLAVASLTTVNTPHAGSPLADIGLRALESASAELITKVFPNATRRVPSYTCALTTQAAWFNTYDPANQRHLNLGRRFRTATEYSTAGREKNYTDYGFVRGNAGAPVVIRDPATNKPVFSIAPTPPAKSLPNDGVVPVWSAIRMPNSFALDMPDADHSYVAENQSNAASIINAATSRGSAYSWRLK